ncbi:MAG: kinase/pyrophosphorylase [Syntrophomonas sp.]|nr:kinase/pyrophosphorylase [Syntrophomonas sp.]
MSTKLHIFAVSDSVGETAEKIAAAASLQYDIDRSITRFSRVTREEQVLEILDRAVKEDAIVTYTLVKLALGKFMADKAAEKGVMAVDLLTPLMRVIREKTGIEPSQKVGLTHVTDNEYFNRVKAIEYAIDHDNGANLDTIQQADLIILGLPRTSKTPLSMHMASLGIKVANFPISLNTEVPEEILNLKDKVPMVGLTIDMETLLELRRERARSFDLPEEVDSLDDLVGQELDNAYRIFAKLKCLVVDVTLADIEEIASSITHKFRLPLKFSHVRMK